VNKQLHNRFELEEIISILKRYENKEIKSEHCMLLLNVSRAQFFNIWKRYREDPKNFQLTQPRKKAPRSLDKKTEKKIKSELIKEKKIIENKKNPVRRYNYSYLKQILEEKHGVSVSLPTIIDRAKKVGAIRKRKRNAEVMIERF
jgi:hypothetical protein